MVLNSYLSIWEENPSEVYKIMESLPCNNGKELSYFLSSNTETLIQMISQLTIIGINSYTVILFGASNKTDFLETLKKGQLLTPEAFPGFIKIFAAMIDKKSYVKTEITTNKKNGEKLKLLVTSYIPGQGNGNMLISMMDITKIKDREDFVRDSIIMASEQRKRSEVLQSILLTLTYSLNREKILNAILLEAKKIVPYSTANIRLLQNKKLNVVASVGYENFEAADFIKQSSISTKEFGDAEKYLDTGTINIIADTNVDPGWKVFPETSFIRGYIGIPFKWKGEISGLLSLDSDKTGTFLESDIEKLEPFAHAVTVALQSSHLFETIKIELEKRKQIELSIKKSLGEKEILLKEIHHRVKNHLTLIMSLINLQSDMLSNNINPNIFEGLKQRIYTISLVHERLYNSKNLSSIELKSYLIDLTSSIRTLSLFKEGIEFKMNMKDDIEIKSDTLIPLALLLNELIINSVKYAFPNEPGIISIDVSEEDGDYEIVFKDNGIGIPEDREQSSSQMGLFLVESLVAQIDGSV
jgi:two-component sensor histidine kinase